jgi:hypothetical protein
MEKKQPGRKKIKLNDSETLDKIVALGSQGLTADKSQDVSGFPGQLLIEDERNLEKLRKL